MTVIRLLLLCGALALTGCAGGGTAPSLFKLDSDYAAPTTSPTTAAPVLAVETVTVAPYLDESGIVYQTAAHRVVIANNNRWASPLAVQLTDTLSMALQRRLTGVDIRRTGSRHGQAPAAQLIVHVDEFLGHYDGTAHIAGQWQLLDAAGKQIAGRGFRQRVILDDDGYAALVSSLSRGWRKQAEIMAPRLKQAVDTLDTR